VQPRLKIGVSILPFHSLLPFLPPSFRPSFTPFILSSSHLFLPLLPLSLPIPLPPSFPFSAVLLVLCVFFAFSLAVRLIAVQSVAWKV